jgi:hypothetical protein
MFVMVIPTPGMTAPEASVTIPVIVAVVWPKLLRGAHRIAMENNNTTCL